MNNYSHQKAVNAMISHLGTIRVNCIQVIDHAQYKQELQSSYSDTTRVYLQQGLHLDGALTTYSLDF